jgi:hypothetical protein
MVESKTHPQIAMLARRRTISRHVELSQSITLRRSDGESKFSALSPCLDEDTHTARSPAFGLARDANAFANPGRDDIMHGILQVSEVVFVNHVKGGGGGDSPLC